MHTPQYSRQCGALCGRDSAWCALIPSAVQQAADAVVRGPCNDGIMLSCRDTEDPRAVSHPASSLSRAQ
ncbi:hypothetical protein E2C01_032282 [Portunus trituberculatus]|uniref:Uncharacterized protein n=1 Tax=Portunus trituberculatus TaxID=210409 RepID=A0A5B7F0I7_PORTR|nr:hypothetical protein [Portunus trituberculatus]